jgi:hypothetical protein
LEGETGLLLCAFTQTSPTRGGAQVEYTVEHDLGAGFVPR